MVNGNLELGEWIMVHENRNWEFGIWNLGMVFLNKVKTVNFEPFSFKHFLSLFGKCRYTFH